ncbi:MAG: YceD family protein [Bryobacteraceae bacterium]
MFISLQELQLRTVRFRVDIPPGEIEYGKDITQSSVLHTEGTAQLLNRSLGEIRIQGTLSVSGQALCDRCVEAATFPIDTQFDLVYMPAEEAATASENEIGQAGLEVGYYEGAGLALNDVVREVVLLALPMQLVCAEACKGICPECGENRNQRPCDCHTKPVDDRWSKLKNLRAELAPPN